MESVLERGKAENVVVAYVPQKFPVELSPEAKQFIAFRAQASPETTKNFCMDRVLAEHTGIAELDRKNTEEQVEALVVERLKSIQEEAYQKAFEMGRDEGREQALNEYKEELKGKLDQFDHLFEVIQNLKSVLVNQNESHLIQLVVRIAERLAVSHIEAHPETIVEVLKSCLVDAQSDETIQVFLSHSDYQFITDMKNALGKEKEIFHRLKLIESDTLSPGGCVIETNYGSVDATISKRVERVYEALMEKMPKVVEKVGTE